MQEEKFFDSEVIGKIISVVLICTIVTNLATSIHIKGLSDELIGQMVVWVALVFLLINQWPLLNQFKQLKAQNEQLKRELDELKQSTQA